MRRKRISKSERDARAHEALIRVKTGQALTNLSAIYEGFAGKGIPEDQISPRENVFTFQAWRALGRHVRKGEHGVRVTTWINRSKTVTDPETGEQTEKGFRFPRTATVFHVSQTEPDEAKVAA